MLEAQVAFEWDRIAGKTFTIKRILRHKQIVRAIPSIGIQPIQIPDRGTKAREVQMLQIRVLIVKPVDELINTMRPLIHRTDRVENFRQADQMPLVIKDLLPRAIQM